MKNSLIAKASLLTTLLVITGCATSKQAPGPLLAAKVYRITCRATSTSSHLNMFVATGSLAHPLVALADNNGYPPVRELYARPLSIGAWRGLAFLSSSMGPRSGRRSQSTCCNRA